MRERSSPSWPTTVRHGGKGRNGSAGSGRIIFELSDWFDVSSALFQDGLATQMTGADFKRYVALRYLANKNRKNVIQESLCALAKLDGVSPRRAHEVNAHLEEMGMVEVKRNANPYQYRLYMPSEWRQRAPSGSKIESNPEPRSIAGVAWR